MNLKEAKLFSNWLLNKVLVILAIATVISYLISSFFTPYDSTDVPGKRSGLRLYKDAKTGCEYLSANKNGLVKRVDINGTHIGCVNKGK